LLGVLFTGCEAGAAGAEGAAGEEDPGGAGGAGGIADVPGAWTGAATGAGLAGMKSGPFCPHPAISATLAIRIALQGTGK
jgi:hypothetical protein